jgi:hypothetical protein
VINKILIILIGVMLWTPFCFAKNIYVAQNSTGASNGADCPDAYSATWFNTGSNWGSAATQINPGDTVHLCGIFTGAAGSTMLTVQGSGAAGQPITILFEPNAVLAAPYWPYDTGAINCNNHAYITIDGGSNGLIQNTADGTALTYQQNSRAIEAGTPGCSNFTVKNLHISNLYIRTQNTNDSVDTSAISMEGSNSIASHNTIDHTRVGIILAYGKSSNLDISFNTSTFTEVAVIISDLYGGASLTGAKVHDNDWGGGAYLWDSPSNEWHHNGIHAWSVHPGTVGFTGLQVYNNYMHGVWGSDTAYAKATGGSSHITAGIYLETVGDGPQVFNNVIQLLGPLNQGQNGSIFCKTSDTPAESCRNAIIVNNTIIGNNSGGSCTEISSTGAIFKNNVCSGISYGLYTPYGETTSTVTANNNAYSQAVNWGVYDNWAGWQSHGQDLNSKLTNLNLNASSFLPNTGSPVIGLGANLTSLGITALDADILGMSRPSVGPWDSGAYVYGGSQVAVPRPPSGLAAVVQ